MKSIVTMLMVLASVSIAGDERPVIPVSVHAQAELAVFKVGKRLPISVTLTNGLSKTIRFSTFATEPNEWNGETLNVSLVGVYRGGEKRNLYLARPDSTIECTSVDSPVRWPVISLRCLVIIGRSLIVLAGASDSHHYHAIFLNSDGHCLCMHADRILGHEAS